MNRHDLFAQIQKKKSFLCVGLDTDIDKIPSHLKDADDPVFEFNKQIIEATKDYCIAYKPNLAFYERLGPKGLQSLEKTLSVIPSDIFTIADAKRGDIGNTSEAYAKAFFEYYKFDSVTVAPYMGKDSVLPFLGFKDKWVILLALTSNAGSMDFQLAEVDLPGRGKDTHLFEHVMRHAMEWGSPDQLMFVAGATHPELLRKMREIAPDYFFLVPGVGAQGGDLAATCQAGLNKQCGMIVNSSRQIIYASKEEDFAERAGKEARRMASEMNDVLSRLTLEA